MPSSSANMLNKTNDCKNGPALFYTMRMNYKGLSEEDEHSYWVTKYKLSPIYNSPLHSHEYMQINYVCRGHAIHNIRQQKCIVSRGDFFIIPPYVAHRLGAKPGEDAEVIQFEFLASFLHQSYQNFDQVKTCVDYNYLRPFLVNGDSVKPRICLSGEAQAEVEAVFSEILKEKEKKLPGYELIIRSMLFKLLILFGREYEKSGCHKSNNGSYCTQHRYVMKAIDYINCNYQKDLSIEQISKDFLISTSYFSFLFREVTSKSFVKYLNGVRINKAQELLKSTDNPVSEIGAKVGFHSLVSFERIFRQELGISPRDYRKIHWNSGT